MAIQSQPSRIPEPFAGSGTKNTIPATNTTPSASQAASWASGFPPECSQPISAGGCPVPRNDVNGALNQLSQDFAFRQDGGIWQWSALADYDTQRMVRGSNGLLYWSVAQSGPSFGSGAVDPTTDSGAFWGAAPMASPGILDRSSKLATTQWVNDAFGDMPIYVDPSTGDDANDGTTAGTAVKTVTQALALCKNRTGDPQTINLAGGTYTEDITITCKNLFIFLSGDIYINGKIIIISSYVRFYNPYTIYLTHSDDVSCISINRQSSLFTEGGLSFTASNISVGVLDASNSAVVYIGGALSLSGSSNYRLVRLLGGCEFDVSGGVTSTQTTAATLFASTASSMNIKGNCNIPGSPCVYCEINSNAVFDLYDNISFTLSGSNGNCIDARYNSYIVFSSTSGYTSESVFNLGNSARACFSSEGYSKIDLQNTSAVFSGKVTTSTAIASDCGFIHISSGTSISGSVTGQRYIVRRLSFINTDGGGENRIPGSTAGSAVAGSYGLYL